MASFDNLTTNIPVSIGNYPAQNIDVLRQYFEGAKAPIRNVSSTGISVVYVFDVASNPIYYDLMQKDPSRHIVYARRLSSQTAKVIGYNKENNDNLTYFHAQSTNATVEYGWQIVSPLQDLQGNALTNVTVSIESENVAHILNNGWLAQAEGTLTAVSGLTISDSANSKTPEQISWRKIRIVSGVAEGEENIIKPDQSGTDWTVAFDWKIAPEAGDKYVILPHQITQSDSNATGSPVTTILPAQKTRVVKYGYKTRDLDLVLDSHYQLPTQLLVDENITEADKSVVAAYTELESAHKLYDYFRYWLSDPANINHGDCLGVAGETITTEYNVTIDPNAAAPFACRDGTITIKAATFTGNVTTTGTITLENGASVTGTIIDASGDSALVFSGVDRWTLYATKAHRDSNASAVDSGVGSYRFNYVSGMSYYFRLMTGDTVLFQDVTPERKGITEVSLATAGQLAALTGIMHKTQSHARAANLQTQKIA